MDIGAIGKMMAVCGVLLVVVGVLLMFGSKIPWLGKLPGDICIEKKYVTFYVPLTTSILVSIVISCILYLMNRR